MSSDTPLQLHISSMFGGWFFDSKGLRSTVLAIVGCAIRENAAPIIQSHVGVDRDSEVAVLACFSSTP
jgi:hypothetical protein